jgi:hypothetical protein
MTVDAGFYSYSSGWEILRQMFVDNGMPDLADIIVASVKNYGAENDALIYQDLRGSEAYKTRFAGNFERLAAGKSFLSEAEYLSQERSYQEIMASYGANDLASRDNFNKFIANDVSPAELANRFEVAYNKVQKAVDANDQALLKQLRDMYPGVTDSEIAKSMLLGNEGSNYLKNRINLADVKAGEFESGIKSTLGAEYLTGQGLDRANVRAGLSKVGEQITGASLAAQTFGADNPANIQSELEKENLLGQQSGKVRKLASQARGQMSLVSGTSGGSLKKKTQL